MHEIRSIYCRKILNSHVEFTNEFVIELDNGSIGVGSSPMGETLSIYEDRINKIEHKNIIETIKQDQYLDIPMDQEKFDDYLQRKINAFGRNNSYALSMAFFYAINKSRSTPQNCKGNNKKQTFPNLCLNILNGGIHAYTNPVLSDFHEYLLVSKNNNLKEMLKDHQEIQKTIKEKLLNKNKIVVNNNLVNKFDTADNRKCIEFLIDVIQELNLTNKYDLMIDAAGTDLWSEQGYRFSLTDNSLKTSDELYEYWMGLIKDYNLKFLEDPFHEKDFESWKKLTTTQDKCTIIGDDLYSGDPQKIQEGLTKKYSDAVMLKPNQAGTVTATIKAIEKTHSNNKILIMSHRSISTESIFLATITHMYNARYIKNGPILTDYSSIIRINELIRLYGDAI
jgi:enolase